MQKLEDFLYDFIGIFIPGFFLLFSLWFTTVSLMQKEVFQLIYDFFSPFHTVLLTNPGYPLVKSVMGEKTIIILMVIIGCYIVGLLLNTFSAWCIKRLERRNRNSSAVDEQEEFYKENEQIKLEVESYLSSSLKVDWNKIDKRNKWITFYRWANLLSTQAEEKSVLNILLSKTILYRSLFLALMITGFYTICLAVASVILHLIFIQGSLLLYASLNLTCIVLCFAVSWFFLIAYRDGRKKLSNEAILILFKVKRGES